MWSICNDQDFLFFSFSVKTRLNSPEGMSFTEFCYQLFQSYDWLYLYDKYKCAIQVKLKKVANL